ncbi:MAG: mechanosensitive ion channel protein MscS [Candidatus Marinimicrobia bacterium]|nr:mechanosensitive ion channel protein MscS [Candidatus Neomarinimicrobiota bacterium]
MDNSLLGIFTKFFTYSSIQAKIIATIIAFILFFVIKKLILRIVYNTTENVKTRYQWHKITSYISFSLISIIIANIWLEGIESIATYLGLVSAGIAIALKEPLTNLTGWLYIIWRSPFDVGDRIQLGHETGDVIDTNLFNFTLMEIGNWVDADDHTGRLIHVPNGLIFTATLANYGKGFKYIWNEMPVLVTFESDWRKAKNILLKIVHENSIIQTKSAEKKFKEAKKVFLLKKPDLEPTVITKVEDSGVELTLRYLCRPDMRRETEHKIWEDILDKFDKYDNIDFAYPTQRRTP